MTNIDKKEAALKALEQARRALLEAENMMHTARSALEDLSSENMAFINHQSDSGALWATARSTRETRSIVNNIIKSVRHMEGTT